MSNRLVRVLKSVRKQGRTHKQAFHVKQASPGDRYAQVKSQTAQPGQSPYLGAQSVAQSSHTEPEASSPNGHMPRIEVQPLVMPWGLEGEQASKDGIDPVPSELRNRFDPENKMTRSRHPLNLNVPLFSVKPGEDLLWGSVEAELLNRLRGSIVIGVRDSGSASNNMLGKFDSPDGVVERAYIRFESLAEPEVYDLYGTMYGIKVGNGDLSRRSAASYELAKAAGLDDIIPPTVYRYDEHSGLEPILSLAAVDDMAEHLGCKSAELQLKLGNNAAIELCVDSVDDSGSELMITTEWFRRLGSDASSLNNFYLECPYRIPLLRGAIFDFLAWTGSRSLAEVVCCKSDRHPVVLVRNDLVFPDPVAIGTAYMEYRGAYTDGCPVVQYAPMLWSDLVVQAALRGYAEEESLYEAIAIDCTKRLRGERVIDLVRSLKDHQISLLSIAGLLVRLAFLRYGATVIMRNPLLVAEYFSSVLTGETIDLGFEMDIDAMVASVDDAIGKSLSTEYSFLDEMRTGGSDDSR